MQQALVVVDMVSTYDFEDGEAVARAARERLDAMAGRIAEAREKDLPVVYVNDHYDRWDGSRERLIEWVLDTTPHADLVRPLLPEPDDAFIVKARHSIFYETPLGYFLNSRELDTLTLVGQVTEQCILYSALDAHVRHFGIRVAVDACVPLDEELGRAALQMMERNMGAELV
ncbi:cysteine hydrolase family protein [Conexibacter sp. SYSU D00693]|uniref:cysteine hydrolase family protein n=1 Tax=Conexibacter sp. SYSU D00693 TaxID=2812560 RepID=UPI00196B651B|nr:isochorismatase family cysteine hydrolase [Conexibacter sp. SYSU D00693]